jgi:hypothetical protein
VTARPAASPQAAAPPSPRLRRTANIKKSPFPFALPPFSITFAPTSFQFSAGDGSAVAKHQKEKKNENRPCA